MDDALSLAKHANNRRVSITLRDRFPYPYGLNDAKNFIERAMSAHLEKNFCIDIDRSAVGGIGFRLGEETRHSICARHTRILGDTRSFHQ